MSNYDLILWAVLIIALVMSIRIASKREKKLAVIMAITTQPMC